MNKIIYFSIALLIKLSIAFSVAQEQTNLIKYRLISMPKDTNSYIVSNFSMYFNQNQSVVIFDGDTKIGNDTTVRIGKKQITGKAKIYKNFSTNKMLAKESAFNEPVLVDEAIPKIEWKILTETKKIEKIKCQKAECDFRGRHYTAWFAPEIPIGNGPWKFQGLPGLILEASDNKNEFRFQFVGLYMPSPKGNAIKIEPIQPTDKEKTLSFTQFASLSKENLSRFRKMMMADPSVVKYGATFKIDVKTIEILPDN
jgi:GLPGLI family protein